MPRSAAEIQSLIDVLDLEISSSARSVSAYNRSMTTRSTDEAIKARALLKDELATATATESGTRRVRQIRLYGGPGF